MATQESVLEVLAEALPLETELLFYYISTPPTPSAALFSTPPNKVEEKALCESHFLGASIPAKAVVERELLVFGIEVLIFTAPILTTIFVSKADSTGYLHLLKTQPGAPSIIRNICTTFLLYLVKQRLDRPRVLLSLFARSQNQYLFPGSSENPGKHVLDDRQLIKWWCWTLDRILRDFGPATATPSVDGPPTTSSEAYIVVPGCDRLDTRAFFPPSAKSEPVSRWSDSYPRDLIVPDGLAPPRCLIPRFPDDPKARFLEDLDSEVSDSDLSRTGQWRSVKSLDQFWEMMSYRQECSAGRLVGFIWIVFTTPQHGEMSLVSSINGFPEDTEQTRQMVGQLATPNQSLLNNLKPVLPPLPSENDALEPIKAASPPPSSPLPKPTIGREQLGTKMQGETHQQDEKTNPTSQQSSQEDQSIQSYPKNQNPEDLFHAASKTAPIPSHPAPQGPLLLSSQNYQLLLFHLLDSDFSTQFLAADSTSSWIHRACELAGQETSDSWGQSVIGRKPVVQSNGYAADRKNSVNILTGVRKKRKVADDRTAAAGTVDKNEGTPIAEAVVLPTNLIRKKRKVSV